MDLCLNSWTMGGELLHHGLTADVAALVAGVGLTGCSSAQKLTTVPLRIGSAATDLPVWWQLAVVAGGARWHGVWGEVK
jgi:hypothetical protein